MVLTDIDTSSMKFLKITDFENILNIYQDSKGNYFFNLNNSLYLNIANDALLSYTNDYVSHWPLISYKIYGTTRLAWLLMKINNVEAKDVFKYVEIGTKIKYLPKDQMNGLITTLNHFND